MRPECEIGKFQGQGRIRCVVLAHCEDVAVGLTAAEVENEAVAVEAARACTVGCLHSASSWKSSRRLMTLLVLCGLARMLGIPDLRRTPWTRKSCYPWERQRCYLELRERRAGSSTRGAREGPSSRLTREGGTWRAGARDDLKARKPRDAL